MAGIEIIEGKNNILVIAPHGVKEDDENTGKLARRIAKEIECHAIINEVYRKPKKKNGDADKENNIVNLNDANHVKANLKTEFLDPLVSFVKERKEKEERVLLVWLHGISDENAQAEREKLSQDKDCIFIGRGQGKEPSYTAIELTANWFKELLEKNKAFPIKALEARIGSNYCGNNPTNMNQYFKQRANSLKKVESIQLELPFTGYRDDKSIEKAAQTISGALKTLSNALPAEAEADNALVEKAFQALGEILSKHYENAMTDAGKFLVKEFYGGSIELAKNNKPTKGKSLLKLIKDLEKWNPNSPSKSWIYNSVRLVVDTEEFKDFHTYGKLPLSHKVLLFPVKDRKTKEQLIAMSVEKNLTASKLRDEIGKLHRKAPSQDEVSIPRLLGHPEKLLSDDVAPKLDVQALAGDFTKARLGKLRGQVGKAISKIEKEIAKYRADAKKREEEYLPKYQALLENVIKAEKEKGKRGKAK